MNINPAVKAITLSVLLSPTDSITCGIYLDEEYCNVSLNLEQDVARLLGYDSKWAIYDENIEAYNSESPTFEEAEEDGSIEMFEMDGRLAYVSRETEKEIFRQLAISLQAQFKDEMFKDRLTKAQQEESLSKIQQAANLL